MNFCLLFLPPDHAVFLSDERGISECHFYIFAHNCEVSRDERIVFVEKNMKDTMRRKEVLNFALYSIPGDPPVISLAFDAFEVGRARPTVQKGT